MNNMSSVDTELYYLQFRKQNEWMCVFFSALFVFIIMFDDFPNVSFIYSKSWAPATTTTDTPCLLFLSMWSFFATKTLLFHLHIQNKMGQKNSNFFIYNLRIIVFQFIKKEEENDEELRINSWLFQSLDEWLIEHDIKDFF